MESAKQLESIAGNGSGGEVITSDPNNYGIWSYIYQKSSPTEPEKNLMRAVLEKIIEDFQKYAKATDRTGKTYFLDAEECIFDTGRYWPYSFENLCEALDFDPNYLRQGLKNWKNNLDSSESSQIPIQK